jgi:hypothetical protein
VHRLNDEIASVKALLNSYHISCERKRQEAESLNSEIIKFETLVSRFKSNNEEYLKIKQTVEEKASSVLTDGKVIYDEEYNAMILEVADKLYNTLLKQLVSTIMDNTTAADLRVNHRNQRFLGNV